MAKEVMSGWTRVGNVSRGVSSVIRECIFGVLRVGPIPNHIAFIMDGNRRYDKKQNPGGAAVSGGHDAAFWALVAMVMYCYELGVKYVTAYAFSIDNFKRKSEDVQILMDSMLRKFDLLEKVAIHFAIRVHFAGNLGPFNNEFRVSAMKLMEATAGYSNSLLTICVAYTSRDEILHAIEESCEQKCIDHVREINSDGDHIIKLMDLEKNMYMAVAPDPDIIIRTEGENRLSNFLLWQSCGSHLCSMSVLWPEIELWNLVLAILNFQKHKPYLERKKKEKQV
ncbi:Dehydrodolichyl diphosphate synthase 6 [Hibiscus syriacus]|uniref:Alkyl transferase n=1 Tax=Hibiscus syriacus TaxID=106335 RepID=A0A6A3CD31_HIBSY|nr:dehydrodolichyl diphosphate synthase CPT3-like [Hibiscus syriacus]KAE8727100.1 Dehydrodolichyl diphosphate synthase 6 [Hibiscus syriacus]